MYSVAVTLFETQSARFDQLLITFRFSRKLIKITLKDGVKETKKTEKLFESLMGKKPELRFKFIQKMTQIKMI